MNIDKTKYGPLRYAADNLIAEKNESKPSPFDPVTASDEEYRNMWRRHQIRASTQYDWGLKLCARLAELLKDEKIDSGKAVGVLNRLVQLSAFPRPSEPASVILAQTAELSKRDPKAFSMLLFLRYWGLQAIQYQDWMRDNQKVPVSTASAVITTAAMEAAGMLDISNDYYGEEMVAWIREKLLPQTMKAFHRSAERKLLAVARALIEFKFGSKDRAELLRAAVLLDKDDAEDWEMFGMGFMRIRPELGLLFFARAADLAKTYEEGTRLRIKLAILLGELKHYSAAKAMIVSVRERVKHYAVELPESFLALQSNEEIENEPLSVGADNLVRRLSEEALLHVRRSLPDLCGNLAKPPHKHESGEGEDRDVNLALTGPEGELIGVAVPESVFAANVRYGEPVTVKGYWNRNGVFVLLECRLRSGELWDMVPERAAALLNEDSAAKTLDCRDENGNPVVLPSEAAEKTSLPGDVFLFRQIPIANRPKNAFVTLTARATDIRPEGLVWDGCSGELVEEDNPELPHEERRHFVRLSQTRMLDVPDSVYQESGAETGSRVVGTAVRSGDSFVMAWIRKQADEPAGSQNA